MKNVVVLLFAGLAVFTQTALGCDEACLKEKAQQEHSVNFPSYLTWKYCDGLKLDFINIDMESLQSYSSSHFDTKYKGPIKNTIRFLDQRKDWLSECDKYMEVTGKGRVFDDKKTTDLVFGRMESIRKELQGIVDGVTYSSANGDETAVIVGEKFNSLFEAVDDHKNLMHLKGRYVSN